MVSAQNVEPTATEIASQINVETPHDRGVYTGRQPGY
jgi:hypothetical protein